MKSRATSGVSGHVLPVIKSLSWKMVDQKGFITGDGDGDEYHSAHHISNIDLE